jgi:mRNA interferase RelE/StbE
MDLWLKRDAVKKLRKMQPKMATAVLDELERIALDPFARHANVKPMEGRKDAFRLRKGNWRAVYVVDRKTQVMSVELIGVRGDIYK